MTQEQTSCEKPEMLKGKPEECSPQQVEECHGARQEHVCQTPANQAEKKKCCCGS
ncbi:MAG: hypothetical protein K9G39_06600 [Chlorobium sp.]|uniref:hypothetical protein n=1 Tax=Chlorobium sp. TaxID=1095 RepID=UPI0025BA5B60|nr:hypothetical protein [Chlorobium sp.]MCF8383252.1 hypothetical protein [Chlorobium sp.]